MNRERLNKLLAQLDNWIEDNPSDTSFAGNLVVITATVLADELDEGPVADLSEESALVARAERRAIISKERGL